MPDLKIRLRSFTDPSTRGAVIPATDITHTNVAGDAAVLRFSLPRDVAGNIEQPLYVGAELYGSGGWFTPRDNLFTAYEDQSEDAEAGRFITFVAVSYVADRVATHFIGPDGVVDDERTWSAASAGKVLTDLFAQHSTLAVTRTFTAGQDSNGVPWPTEDVTDQTFRELASIDSVLSSLTGGAFCEWHTAGAELVLKVAGTGLDLADVAAPVKVGPGAKSVKVKTSVEDTATDFIIVSDQDDVPKQYVTRPSIGVGSRQAIITVAGATTAEAALRMAEPIIDSMSTVRREVTVFYESTVPFVPYETFNIGDVLKVKSRGAWESRRLIGIQVQTDDTKTTVRLTFGERFLTLQAKLAGRMTKVSLGTVTGAGGNGGVIPPSKTPSSGEPSAPASVAVVANTAEFLPDGSAIATVTLDWPTITQTVDGANTLVTEYELWSRRVDGPSARIATSTDSTITIDLPAGAERVVKVRASNGRHSAFSPEAAVVAALPEENTAKPSAPSLVAGLGVVTVSWNGLIGGSAPGAGFRRVIARYRLNSGSWKIAATFTTVAGQVATIQASKGDVVEAQLAAEDTQGRTSPWSSTGSVTVGGVTVGDLDDDVAAATLRIVSTRGTAFKNNAIATVLTVTVFYGGQQITDITALQAAFGTGAYLEWQWRRMDDSAFGIISSADSRLSQAGFALTVTPADVDEQTVFQCNLNT